MKRNGYLTRIITWILVAMLLLSSLSGLLVTFAHAAGALAVGVGFGTTPVQVLSACADLVVDSLDPLGRPEFWRTAAKRRWGQASA